MSVSPGSFTFHEVEVVSEEFIYQLNPGEGKVCLQGSQWASTWALLGSTMVPHIHMADDVILSLENGPKWYVHQDAGWLLASVTASPTPQ